MVWQESNGTDDTIPTITVLMRSVEAQTAPLADLSRTPPHKPDNLKVERFYDHCLTVHGPGN